MPVALVGGGGGQLNDGGRHGLNLDTVTEWVNL